MICEFKIIISWLFQKCRNAEMQKCRNAEMQKKGKGKSKSFTLVEIVFTISIIGILLAILLPAMSAIKLSAQKVKDVSNLQKIAEAWRECVINRGWSIDGRDPWGTYCATVFIEQLAGRGKTSPSDIVLNDPYVYISPGDKYASKVIEELIGFFDTNEQAVSWKEAFSTVANFMVSNSHFISYCLMCNLPPHAPLNTTPLGFTRGLCEDGKWDEKAGLYGSKGGYVVYCDGHVTWFDGNKPAKFLKWDQSGYTNDIRGAVLSSTWITCGNPQTKRCTSGGKLVLLHYAGTGGE
ncbi:MAG: prepilin-type N-terminal cleavage/methylation domain-containing protein [Puniceicoccales bacterium]|jgi:prepilin-type processing-associated H-X9-DG protein|nr:prepilin-type N-terminal cleavage/methylation domain-containing protein [Puniceicoccales bacterium]